MKSNWDKYLDPPDEPEEEYCESCGEVMVEIDNFGGRRYMECVNKCCPEKHTGVARELAVDLADTKASLDEMKKKVKHLVRLIKIYDPEFEY